MILTGRDELTQLRQSILGSLLGLNQQLDRSFRAITTDEERVRRRCLRQAWTHLTSALLVLDEADEE